ncbi:hypothetical protein [Streptomyces luteolus]|uniref:Uncharacterized protein n=1 Tax=Streptomyces luteolus TaxID=3043615 RepID=A0ABT6T4K0_9ACTN|nr:hypothetical protein [Streptomyces sp. B-S-A12]MDI3422803.1 hypothetical protein [Streptomyces sp. B-S-A12]
MTRERMLRGPGLVVFETPVDMGASKPIVAISWNTWDPAVWPGGSWLWRRNDHVHDEQDGPRTVSVPAAEFAKVGDPVWWFTLYTLSPISGGPPIAWETEMIVADGAIFDRPDRGHQRTHRTGRDRRARTHHPDRAVG